MRLAPVIVAGAIALGVGLYVGLRPRSVPVTTPRTDPAVDARHALDALKPRLVERCGNQPGRFTYDLTFGPDGKQVARGISEVRDEPSPPDVAACLRADPEVLRIAPPGRTVRVTIDLRFP